MRMIISAERDRLMDYTYGVRYVDGKWMISPLEIDEDDNFIIKGVRYKGTPGLYELVFMKEPDEGVYNEADLTSYKAILIATNAHKHHYLASAQINSNRGTKYKKIISIMFPTKRTGHRHVSDDNNRKRRRVYDELVFNPHGIDYVHWDDPNELVD